MYECLLFVVIARELTLAFARKISKYLTDFNICVKTGMTEREDFKWQYTHYHMLVSNLIAIIVLFAHFKRAFVRFFSFVSQYFHFVSYILELFID